MRAVCTGGYAPNVNGNGATSCVGPVFSNAVNCPRMNICSVHHACSTARLHATAGCTAGSYAVPGDAACKCADTHTRYITGWYIDLFAAAIIPALSSPRCNSVPGEHLLAGPGELVQELPGGQHLHRSLGDVHVQCWLREPRHVGRQLAVPPYACRASWLLLCTLH